MAENITKELVRQHLVELGYDEGALDGTAMESFIEDLREMYLSGEFAEQEFQTDKKSKIFKTQNIIKNQYKEKEWSCDELDIGNHSTEYSQIASKNEKFDDYEQELSSIDSAMYDESHYREELSKFTTRSSSGCKDISYYSHQDTKD
jgi:hypothetical protein